MTHICLDVVGFLLPFGHFKINSSPLLLFADILSTSPLKSLNYTIAKRYYNDDVTGESSGEESERQNQRTPSQKEKTNLSTTGTSVNSTDVRMSRPFSNFNSESKGLSEKNDVGQNQLVFESNTGC